MATIASAECSFNDRMLWSRILGEASDILMVESALLPFLTHYITSQQSLAQAVCLRIADLLAEPSLPACRLLRIFEDLMTADRALLSKVGCDLAAVLERDPATVRALHVLLYLKGFHAIQLHRFTHALWQRGRCDLAVHFQSRSSRILQVDIHPAVKLGGGVFFDHATGIVIGETAVIEDDVSILQNVTLGGTGKHAGDRHPKVRRGVLIGAGATVLGNIELGANARIGAGSVVLRLVESRTTVVGVPARIVGSGGALEPARAMNHMIQEARL